MKFLSKHKGASLIIAMVLSVLILLFSLNMAQQIKSTQGNVKRSLDAGDFQAAQESIQQQAQALATEGEDRIIQANLNNQTLKTEVWASTGCPIPTNQDFGDDMRQSSRTNYQLEGGNNPQTIFDYCYSDQNYTNYYFVYPTPVVFSDASQSNNLVGSNCDPQTLYSTYNGSAIDPIEHPCYWGRLEAGETIRIPLNQFDWDLADISNLKLRFRTPCEDGSTWCEDIDRLKYNASIAGFIDNSTLIATWVFEIDKGIGNFGSSKGYATDFNDFINCDTVEGPCRAPLHSEITEYRMSTGRYYLSNPFLDILNLGTSLSSPRIIDLSTNKAPDMDENLFYNYLKRIFPKAEITLILTNVSRDDNHKLEYQIISNRKLVR